MTNVAINLADLIAFDEFAGPLHMLYQNLVSVPIQDIWLPLGEFSGFPNCPNHPRSLPSFSTSNQQVVLLKAKLN